MDNITAINQTISGSGYIVGDAGDRMNMILYCGCAPVGTLPLSTTPSQVLGVVQLQAQNNSPAYVQPPQQVIVAGGCEQEGLGRTMARGAASGVGQGVGFSIGFGLLNALIGD
jgi:hypothetical protein